MKSIDEEYEIAKQTSNGVGGYGSPSIPKENYKGWNCPTCYRIYAPMAKECSYCNRVKRMINLGDIEC